MKVRQKSFFDEENRMEKISKIGDPFNVIKLRKRKKVTGTVKVSVTFIMSNFMNRM